MLLMLIVSAGSNRKTNFSNRLLPLRLLAFNDWLVSLKIKSTLFNDSIREAKAKK